MNERVHGALVQLGCYQYSPCGKVHNCTMKTRGLPQIIRTFSHRISTNTVKKFYTAALCDTQRRFAGVQLTVINSWRRWQARTIRKWYLIAANRAAHCVLQYQSHHAANNSTGSLPAHSSLTISPSLSAIHTSSGKVLQCSDHTLYSVPTAKSVRLRSEVWLCSQSYEWTSSSEVNIPQHACYFHPRSALWRDKHVCVLVHS